LTGVRVLDERAWDEEQRGATALPLVVGFWAEWCLPSLGMEPALRAAAQRFDGRLRFATVDVDASPGLADRQGIVGLPTLLILAGGQERVRRIGAMSRADLLDLLERYR
jgi:thioredoxin-like negative regulator of GroEL